MAVVHITVLSTDPVTDAESLAGWLRGEPGLTGRVRPGGAGPRPGEMGSPADVLTVAVGSGGAVAVLATAVRTWLAHPRRSDARVRIRREDGTTVEIDVKRARSGEAEGLLRAALGDTPDHGPQE